jgi:hypothetical protein
MRREMIAAAALLVLSVFAAFGGLMLIAACVMLAFRQARSQGAVMLGWGSIGALAGFALFAFVVLIVVPGREPLLSQAAALFSAAGFGLSGVAGLAFLLIAQGLRLPNRWADRRRLSRVH